MSSTRRAFRFCNSNLVNLDGFAERPLVGQPLTRWQRFRISVAIVANGCLFTAVRMTVEIGSVRLDDLATEL
jgi:hypothetical protein